MNIGLRNCTLALLNTSRSLNKDFRTFHRWLKPTLVCLKKKQQKLGPVKPQKRNTFLEWNYNAELYAFQKRLGEEFNNDLLKIAFIEKSYVVKEEERLKQIDIEPSISVEDNTEMAIDGEKLISSYILQYLEATLPNLPKNYIRKLKDHLTGEEILAKVSKGIGIDDLVLCAENPVDSSTLAHCLKSVIQALALSKGTSQANTFIRDLIVVQLVGEDLTSFCMPDNPIEALQSLLKDIGVEHGEARLISEAGRNTILASYQVGIYSNRKMIGRGVGESVEIARDMAACDALWRKWGILPGKKPFPFKLELPASITA